MTGKNLAGDNPLSGNHKMVYDHLLGRARGVADQTLERLRDLDEHFPSILPPDALERMPEAGLRRDPPHDESERRSAPRRNGRRAQVIVFAVASPEVVMAWVDDWSASGVGLWLPRALDVGSLVYVLPDDSPEAATGALVEVRHCRPAGEGWAVGCRLVRATLPPEQLFGAEAPSPPARP